MTSIGILPVAFINSQIYGTVGDGVTDDTANIQAAINAANVAGTVDIVLTGKVGNTFLISSTLVSAADVRINGLGLNVTIIKASASFTGSCMVSLSGVTFCGLRDLTLQANSSTYSSNGAFDGIDMIGTTDIRLENVEIDYVNGWGVLSQSTSGVGNTHMIFDNVTVHLAAQGFHLLGNSGSGGVGLHKLIDCNASGIQNGDCYLIEDIHDILMLNPTGEVVAGTGASLHVKGNVGAVTVTNCDFGPAPGPSSGAVIQISAGPNGTPKNITVLGGIVEGGSIGVAVNNGTFITISGTRIFNNNTAGVSISDPASVHVIGCNFNQNGSQAGTGRYDLVNTSTQPCYISNNKFDTPQGNSAGQVNACISDIGSGGLAYYNGNFHNSVNGWTDSNIYASGNAPYFSANVQGVVTTGVITAPTFTGSPQTFTKSRPCTVYVGGGTVTEIDVGGTNTGLTKGTFDLPAHIPITITYSVAPTCVWVTQ